MTRKITKKQQSILSAVFCLAKKNKVWPTFKEIELEANTGIGNVSSRLIPLEAKELIETLPSVPQRVKLKQSGIDLMRGLDCG